MILGQTLETRCVGETLREKQARGEGEFVLLGRRPAVNVLEQAREGGLFKRLLEILVSAKKLTRAGEDDEAPRRRTF